ncbi:chalcone isomerase family protein [Aquimarina agarivorans]|uniref:chalcone isomerase family protein n=1 Tax=Aquimarina agarivorans TaxID=980584 RepID=UPI000248E89D|nr:chalcone isomerase family protein [Aquimarina agarivorans]
MKQLLFYLTLFFTTVIVTTGYSQIPVGRTVMEYEVEYGDTTLKMNGAGTRSLLFIELYSGGLYLQEKSNDPIAIAYDDETMAIRIKITSKLIKRETMLSAIEEGFVKATDGKIGPLKDRIAKIRDYYAKPIKKGDLLELVYIKGKGIVCYMNSKELGVIEGQDFKFALFKVWLGENPASESLKKGMLGDY